jgi:hypothetical protein
MRILIVYERKRNALKKMCFKRNSKTVRCSVPHIFKGNTKLQIAEGGNNVSDECEAIAIKLFVSNYLINRSVRYLFWHRGAAKKNC